MLLSLILIISAMKKTHSFGPKLRLLEVLCPSKIKEQKSFHYKTPLHFHRHWGTLIKTKYERETKRCINFPQNSDFFSGYCLSYFRLSLNINPLLLLFFLCLLLSVTSCFLHLYMLAKSVLFGPLHLKQIHF